MKSHLFYTQDFLRAMYEFLESRLPTYKIPNIILELNPDNNQVHAYFISSKEYKPLINKLKSQNLIEDTKDSKVFLNMSYLLRLSFSEVKVHSYGVSFTNPVDDGVVEFAFECFLNYHIEDTDIRELPNVVAINAGSYLHALIKLKIYLHENNVEYKGYELIRNSHPFRFLSSATG